MCKQLTPTDRWMHQFLHFNEDYLTLHVRMALCIKVLFWLVLMKQLIKESNAYTASRARSGLKMESAWLGLSWVQYLLPSSLMGGREACLEWLTLFLDSCWAIVITCLFNIVILGAIFPKLLPSTSDII